MTELDRWPSLAIAIGMVTAHRAGIGYMDLPGGQAPGEAVDGLVTIIDALLSVLMSGDQADAVLRALGLAAITATSTPEGNTDNALVPDRCRERDRRRHFRRHPRVLRFRRPQASSRASVSAHFAPNFGPEKVSSRTTARATRRRGRAQSR